MPRKNSSNCILPLGRVSYPRKAKDGEKKYATPKQSYRKTELWLDEIKLLGTRPPGMCRQVGNAKGYMQMSGWGCSCRKPQCQADFTENSLCGWSGDSGTSAFYSMGRGPYNKAKMRRV